MCGRYLALLEDDYDEIEKLIHKMSDKFKDTDAAKGEIFPTDHVPVIYSHKGKNILSSARWGFPAFKGGGIIINARAEQAAEKPMFRDSFLTKRCILPAKGFFEWQTHADKRKTKYCISLKEKKIFYMAGLYNLFTDKNGRIYPAVTILTTDANPDISFIHDRMPVILPEEAIGAWLDKNNTDRDFLQELLKPYAAGQLEYKEV